MDRRQAASFVKIMVADSFLRGHVARDEVTEIWRELDDRDDEPDAPGWGDVMVKSSLALAILGMVAFMGLFGWLMAIR